MAQGAARRHLQAPKSAQKQCVSLCFLHTASFVALMLLRAFLDPSWCQLGLSRVVFGPQNWIQNGPKMRPPNKTLFTQRAPGIFIKLSKEQPKTKIGFLNSLGPLLDHSWPLLHTLGPLLAPSWALLGLPEGVQKGSQKGTPKKSALEPIFGAFWGPILGTFLAHFWVPFLIQFFDDSWLHLGL